MIQVWVWLFTLFVSAGMAGLLGIQLVLGRKSRSLVLLTTSVLAIGYCLLAADSLRAAGRFRLDSGYLLLLQAVIVVLVAGAVALQFGAGRWLLPERPAGWTRASIAGLLVCQLTVAGWAGWRLRESATGSSPLPLLGTVDLEAIPGEALLTEKGRLIQVYRSRIAPDVARYVETLDGAFANRRIQRAGQDERANCHGWVFTGGQYLLLGRDVERILADNEYQVVTQPQAGDVIVYRDAFNQILHTGLVRIALDDDTVLIESKWGIDERFLHLPEDQHYSQWFSYYRRPAASSQAVRGSPHLVQAVKILPGNVIVSQRSEEALAAHPQLADPQLDRWADELLPRGESYPLGAE